MTFAPISAALLATAAGALAQTITVTTVYDISDFPAPQTAAQLPGPDGLVSFREACIASNNTPGPQTIAFAIPQSTWWFTTDRATLRQENGIFLLSDNATTVDFTTQTAFTGNTNPLGNEVAIYGLEPNSAGVASIYITGNNCTIKGLDGVSQRGHAVQLVGNNNRVIGCTIWGPLYSGVYITGGFGAPPATGNTVGGTGPGEGNTLTAGNHGVRIDTPAQGNFVIGNTLTGVYAGVAVRGNPTTGSPVGNRIGGPGPGEGNVIAGAGRYGEEGFPDGAQVDLSMAAGTIVEGNFIGTTPDGLAAAPGQRGPAGVSVVDSTGTVIRGNVIGGIRVAGVNHYAGQFFGDGVRINALNAPTSDTRIENNLIGVGADGQSAVPNLYGVRVVPAIASRPVTQTLISANTVAFSERNGVVVAYSVSGVRVMGNSIHSSGGIGIDLLGPGGATGITPNDPGDPDLGGNGLQNFPLLDAAVTGPSGTTISGSFNSLANQQFVLEFFANPSCHPSGHGEGRVLLGSAQIATDSAGNATFSAPVPGSANPGAAITATATHLATGNTSEFSACITATGAPSCYANCDNSTTPPVLNVLDFSCFLNRFAAADPYANCDGSTTPPVLNVLDFGCFLNSFAAGCP